MNIPVLIYDDGHRYVDGSIGEDHNKSPMGGGLYNGSTLCFPRKYTRLSGGFVQNDMIGIEVDMGRCLLNLSVVPFRAPPVEHWLGKLTCCRLIRGSSGAHDSGLVALLLDPDARLSQCSIQSVVVLQAGQSGGVLSVRTCSVKETPRS